MNPNTLTDDQLKEFQTILSEIKAALPRLKELPGPVTSLKTESETTRKDLTETRRALASRLTPHVSRTPGFVTDECARHLTGIAIAARLRSGKYVENADYLYGLARDILGIEIKTALSSTDIPLPVEYSGQVVELVSA